MLHALANQQLSLRNLLCQVAHRFLCMQSKPAGTLLADTRLYVTQVAVGTCKSMRLSLPHATAGLLASAGHLCLKCLGFLGMPIQVHSQSLCPYETENRVCDQAHLTLAKHQPAFSVSNVNALQAYLGILDLTAVTTSPVTGSTSSRSLSAA